MSDVLINLIILINQSALWILFAAIFVMAVKYKLEWASSIRSLITMLVCFTFCSLAYTSKVDPKDFMLIVSLVMNFYFLSKKRHEGENGNGVK